MKKSIFSIFIVFILLFNNTFTWIVYSVDDVLDELNNLSSGFDDNIWNLWEKDDDIITEEVIYDDIDLDNKDDAELELQTLEDNELEDNTNDDIDLEDDLEVDENLEIISSGYNDDEIVDDEIIDENLDDIINEEVIHDIVNEDIIGDVVNDDNNWDIQDEGKTEDISSTDDEVQELETQDPLLNIQNNEEEEKKEQWFLSNLWKIIKSFFLVEKNGYLVWSETIDNITISIEAEKWVFPEWTEVMIKWVSEEKLESIQTSLVEDETNNITEDAQILAFDISFVYSWEEIQPEREISVKFNYKDNLDFQWVSTSQVSVYHIDDKTDEWTEIEVANKNGDEIEILATEFSIYVLTLTQNTDITLTLNPGNWIIITWDNNIVVDEYGNWTITSSDGNVILPDATRENHVFVWWYTSQTPSLQNFVWTWWNEYHVDGNTTLYASWCNDGYTINTEKTTCILEWNLKTILDQNPNFTYGQIWISKPDWWLNDEDPDIIIIMDRNLWASSFGINTSAWWYYYQWWNNYWFTQNPPTIARDIANVNLSIYWPWNPYYSWTYVIWKVNNTTYPTWATTQNYNIWWYNTDEDEDKQWPCPDGWHVPSIAEWNRLVGYWTWNNGWMNISRFRSELGLPLAGWLTRSTAVLESGDIHGWYRTVTPNTNKQWAYDFDITSSTYNWNYSENLVNWRQIRCFMNKSQPLPTFTVRYTDWVDDREIFWDQVYSGLLMWDDFPQFVWLISSRTGDNWVYHEFLWWFFEWTDIVFDVSGATVNRSVSLYAKWSWCFNENEEANANWICVSTAEWQRNNQIVQDLELYFLANDENKVHYTIMDRNMWATEVFNKYYTGPNPESLGYLYQWWNNYWFPAKWDLVEQWVFTGTSQVPKSIRSAWIPSNYASGVYYLNSADHASWMGSPTISDWIWWWTWDTRTGNWQNTTLEDRQWPCPVWYHIPSTLEWTTIFTDWSWSNIWISHTKVNNKIPAIYKFSEDLLLPPAWRRAANWVIGYENTLSYWSSSPATSNAVRADGLYAKPDDKIEIPNADGRARARSVRCVKNVVNTSETAISVDDIYLDGWWNTVISIDNWVISTLWTPTRIDSTFEWWYITADFSGNALYTWDTVLPWSSLYAKFTCNDSWFVWNWTGCEWWVRLMFDSMWWTDVPMQVVTVWKTWTKPQDPTKTWYLFTGWYESWSDVEFNFVETIITWDITLYARWIISDVSYTVYHYLKDPWLATYSLYTSDEYTWSVGDVININNLAKNNIPCAVFTGGSTWFNNLWPSNIIETLTLEIGWSTGIYLYYTRNTYTLTLDKDMGISSISGSGVYECGQTVTIEAIPKTWYHFKRWDGVLDGGW